MCRHLRLGQRYTVAAKGFAYMAQRQSRALALVTACPVGKVGQLECGHAVAAILGAKQREQCGILPDGQRRAITGCPAIGREVESEQLNLTDERFCHINCPYLRDAI